MGILCLVTTVLFRKLLLIFGNSVKVNDFFGNSSTPWNLGISEALIPGTTPMCLQSFPEAS